MMEFLGTLRNGFLQFTGEGQYLGLFFVGLLFLWLDGNAGAGRKGRLYFLYAAGATALVLFPLSAWALIRYQTPFYSYSQLFLLLPVTGVTAWAFTEIAERAVDWAAKPADGGRWVRKHRGWCEAGAVLAAAFVLMLCGTAFPAAEPTARAENAARVPGPVLEVLQALERDGYSGELLLAPDGVLAHARAYSGEFRLLYGRNMWQKELDAYTYDTYQEEFAQIHEWLNPGEELLRVPNPPAVGDNMTARAAARLIGESGCEVLLLTKAQYGERTVKEALELADDFGYAGETGEYVILQRGQ